MVKEILTLGNVKIGKNFTAMKVLFLIKMRILRKY